MSDVKPISEMNEEELEAFIASLPEEMRQEITHRRYLEFIRRYSPALLLQETEPLQFSVM